MPPHLLHFISSYGYLAIFLLVFFQEIGVPTIVPNEVALLFFGYLAFTGTLHILGVILSAVSADCIGTSLLYTVFYFFSGFLRRNKPSWLPFPEKSFANLKARIIRRGKWGIFLGRLTPLIRAYTSVIAGIVCIAPADYISMVIISAFCWTGSYVIAGYLLGPLWVRVAGKVKVIGQFAWIIIALLILAWVTYSIMKKLIFEKTTPIAKDPNNG